MKQVNRLLFLLLLIGPAACHPRIYRFTVEPGLTVRPDQSLQFSWDVKGTARLRIVKENFPGSGTGPLPDLPLSIQQQGKTLDTLLRDSLVLPLTSKGSLVVRKKPDGHVNDLLLWFRLVAAKNNKDSMRDLKVGMRPDSVVEQVSFPTHLHGDTLVAGGPSDNSFFGNNFYILSVLADTGRVLEVSHAGITRELHPGDRPDYSYKGTAETGDWTIRSLLTAEEKNHQRRMATEFIVYFIIKHK